MQNARRSSKSGHDLWRQLDLYALAASAAGVTLLASHPAHAEIVYTPADQYIDRNQSFSLDLNHDGIPDFQIWNIYSFRIAIEAKLGIKPLSAHNRIAGNSEFAGALPGGVSIGGNARFPQKGDGVMVWFIYSFSTTFLPSSGPWRNVQDRYLGLKFFVDGQAHYGWARLNVSFKNLVITAKLTGYAYETEAGKAIDAGQTTETASELPPIVDYEAKLVRGRKASPGSLGLLALGSASPSIWRRDDELALKSVR